MAVELRCPECRAKLRLPVAPEPDSEIECPKCAHVFPTDNNLVHSGAADEDERPRKKRPRDDDSSDRPKKKKKKGNKGAATAEAGAPPKKKKIRKLKKRKTNPMVLVGASIGGLMVLGLIAGTLIWFFNRKSASQEMMTYLPAECGEVSGVNLGHLQKYPEFYKQCEGTFVNKGFKKAADVFAQALGQESNDTVEYVVQGVGASGVEATVLRAKAEFDTSLLSKIPGAKSYRQDGVEYFTIDDIPELAYPGLRVFAPTNRIVVFCSGNIPEKSFRNMLNGNKDDPDATAYKRSGTLGKQVIRGTAWRFTILEGNGAMPRMSASNTNPQQASTSLGGGVSDEEQLRQEIVGMLSTAHGTGIKASVGSREVRCEWVIQYKDSDAAAEVYKKWKEKEWVNDEEKETPRWWRALASKPGGGKTAANIIRDGLSFRQVGDTFIVRSSMETKIISPSGLVGAVANQVPSSGGPGGGPGRPGGGTGRPGGRRRRIPMSARTPTMPR